LSASVVWLAGTAAGISEVPSALLIGGVAFSLLIWLGLRPTLSRLIAACVLLSLSTAAWLLGVESVRALSPPASVAQAGRSPVHLRGIVAAAPQRADTSQRVRIDVHERLIGQRWEPADTSVLVVRSALPRLRYGDVVEVVGVPDQSRSSGATAYRNFLRQRGIDAVLYYPKLSILGHDGGVWWRRTLSNLREQFEGAFARVLPEPHAALASGVVFGASPSLPPALKDEFNRTGTAHIIAASGANLTIFTGILSAVLSPCIGRRRVVFLISPLIMAYTALIGAPVSAVRAAIMAFIYLGSVVSGRPNSGVAALAIAATFMSAANPLVLTDVSFQLSVAATAGLLVLGPLLERAIRETAAGWGLPEFSERLPARIVSQTGIITLSASVATAPLVALHFHRVSLVAVPANLLVAPLVTPIMLLGVVLVLVDAVVPPLATPLGWALWPFLTLVLTFVHRFAELPFSSLPPSGMAVTLAVAIPALMAVLLVLFGLVGRLAWRPGVRLPFAGDGWYRPGVAICLVLAAVLLWGVIFLSQPQGRLSLRALETGGGNSILLESPAGARLLVLQESRPERLLTALGQELPFWDRRIQGVLLVDSSAGNVIALDALIEHYRIDEVLLISSAAPAVRGQPRHLGTALPTRAVAPGSRLDFGAASLSLGGGPGDESNEDWLRGQPCTVVQVGMGEFSFLVLSTSASARREASSECPRDGRVAVLTAPGPEADSGVPQSIAAGQPHLLIATTSPRASGSAEAVPTDLHGRGLTVDTHIHGTTRLSTDGRRLWLSVDRNAEWGP
jgi:competence protein ComEC